MRQFFQAVFAQLEAADYLYLAEYLTAGEQALFFGMSLPEQRHALNVAYTAEHLAQDTAVDVWLLRRCALLHDVGKTRGDISTVDKVIAVIADGCCPVLARQWASAGKAGWVQNTRHALYIYFNHAELGRDKLLKLGLRELAEIIAKHHKAPAEDDPLELLLLRQADERN